MFIGGRYVDSTRYVIKYKFLYDNMSSFNTKNVANKSTRKDNCIDHIFVYFKRDCNDCEVVGNFYSEHLSIYVNLLSQILCSNSFACTKHKSIFNQTNVFNADDFYQTFNIFRTR